MAEETPTVEPAPIAKPAKQGSLIMMIVIVLLSNAAGAGATWFFLRKSIVAQAGPAATEEKEKKPVDMAEQLEKSAVVPLEAFIVNLADTDTPRYLRIKVSLMVDDKAKIKDVEENLALQSKVRDVILQTLARKTSHDLTNDEGKNKLRHEIQDELGPFFKTPKLNDVMFTEFVIQL